jgi:hypothetical protein
MIPEVVVLTLDKIKTQSQVLQDYKIVGSSECTTIVLRYTSTDILETHAKVRLRPFVVHKIPSQVLRDSNHMNRSNYGPSSSGEFVNGISGYSNFNSTEPNQQSYQVETNGMHIVKSGVDAGVQCGTSLGSLVEGSCQSPPMPTASNTSTQFDGVQKHSIKVGCRPDTRSLRIQTDKTTMVNVGIGSVISALDATTQTLQSTTQHGIDVAVECKQTPGAISRHCQTFCETRHVATSIYPKVVSVATDTTDLQYEPKGNEVNSVIKISTPQGGGNHNDSGIYQDSPTLPTMIRPYNGAESVYCFGSKATSMGVKTTCKNHRGIMGEYGVGKGTLDEYGGGSGGGGSSGGGGHVDADSGESRVSAMAKKANRKQKDLQKKNSRSIKGEYGVGKGTLSEYGGGSVGGGSSDGGGCVDADNKEAGTSATVTKTKRKQRDLQNQNPRGFMGVFGFGKGILSEYGGGSRGSGSSGGGGHGDAESREKGISATTKKASRLLVQLTKMLGGSQSEDGGSKGGGDSQLKDW